MVDDNYFVLAITLPINTLGGADRRIGHSYNTSSLYITSSLSQFPSYLLFNSYSSFPQLDVMSDQPRGRGGRGRGPRGGVFGDRGGRGGRGRGRGDLQDHPFRPSDRGGRGDFRGGHGDGRGDFRGRGRGGGPQGPRIFR